MTRNLRIMAGVLTLMALTAGTALADVTFHSGPTLTWNSDGSASATGDLSGLGNQPAMATLTINTFATYTCQNPGGNTAPGQKSVAVFSSGTQQLSSTDKNGRAVLSVSAPAPDPADTVSGKDAGCPNGHWTGVNPQLTGPNSATLTITQRNRVVYQMTFSQ